MTDELGTRSHALDPGRLSELASNIASGSLSPVALLESYLKRIEITQPHVEAWREVDTQRALDVAAIREREAQEGKLRGPLHGIPFGVKDIIDVEGLTTLCNSLTRANSKPATADAEVVLALKAAGAIVLGKVHTTEFAFLDPSPARNPHNPGHTPGGSSSGSAAAVAAGTVPLSIGTQTMASVNRPAAYCGVSAFKPSTGAINGLGVTPLASSYDTVGFFGATVADAVYGFEAVAPRYLAPHADNGGARAPVIVAYDDPMLADADTDVHDAQQRFREQLEAQGAVIRAQNSPISMGRILELHRLTMIYEAARAQAVLLDAPQQQVGQKLREALEEGRGVKTDHYLDARRELDELRATFLAHREGIDAYIWPATPQAAPAGLGSTGDPRYIAPWTVLGGPMISVPVGQASNGLPLGSLLCGRPGEDHTIAAIARQLEL